MITMKNLTPPPPLHLGATFLGGGAEGGSRANILCVLQPLCVDLDPAPTQFVCCTWAPNLWRGSRVLTSGNPPPHPLPVRA